VISVEDKEISTSARKSFEKQGIKIHTGAPPPADSRTAKLGGLGSDDARLFDIADVLAGIAEERGKSVAQVAINWLLCRPTVISVVIGARSEQQLLD